MPHEAREAVHLAAERLDPFSTSDFPPGGAGGGGGGAGKGGPPRPWMSLTSGYDAMSGTRAGIIVDAVRFAAYQNVAVGKLGGAVTVLETGQAKRIATSTEGSRPVAHPAVLLAMVGLGKPPPWYGSCAEIGTLNLALDSGIDTQGGMSKSFNIAGRPMGALHLSAKLSCEGGPWVLPAFRVRFK